jgi:hypothetical protein
MEPIVTLASSMQAAPGVYALLLGSGVSRAAEVPTGWEVVGRLCRRVAAAEGANPGDDPIAWYRNTHEEDVDYSGLLEDLAKGTGDRQALLEPFFEPTEEERAQGVKLPTKAHRAIAQLVADGHVKVIVTTNFDRLLEMALSEAGVQPQVITSADTARGAVPLNHSQVTIIKVHGDYKSPDLRNTVEELGSYDPGLGSLLAEILDRYGLVICGWSSDYDAALRAAMLKSPNRRYTTYWCRRGALEGEAAALAAARQATEITITDADEFFEELAMKISLIAERLVASPESTALAVAELKRYLPNPLHRIRLHDFMQEESRRTADAVSEREFPTPTVSLELEPFKEVLCRYETQTGRLVSLLANGVYFDEPGSHDDLWLRSLLTVERRPKSMGGNSALIDAQNYPTLLCVFAMGLAGFARGDVTFVPGLLLTEVPNPFGEDTRVLTRAAPPRGIGRGSHHWNNITAAGDARRTPASDRVFEALQDSVGFMFTGEDEYQEAFDFLEMLVSVIGNEKGHNFYFGRFWWRYFDVWGHGRKLPDLGRFASQMVSGGLCDSEQAFNNAVGRLIAICESRPAQ